MPYMSPRELQLLVHKSRHCMETMANNQRHVHRDSGDGHDSRTQTAPPPPPSSDVNGQSDANVTGNTPPEEEQQTTFGQCFAQTLKRYLDMGDKPLKKELRRQFGDTRTSSQPPSRSGRREKRRKRRRESKRNNKSHKSHKNSKGVRSSKSKRRHKHRRTREHDSD